jgi:hypothetical protein
MASNNSVIPTEIPFSLTALAKLRLAKSLGSQWILNGVNALFTKAGSLDPNVAWKPNTFRGVEYGSAVRSDICPHRSRSG